MPSKSPTSLVISNVPPEHAEGMAKSLVEHRVAACVTLTPVKSVYRWEGDLCVDTEVTLTAKVSEPRIKACVALLESMHPYELPEVLVLTVNAECSSADYQAWVARECEEQPVKS